MPMIKANNINIYYELHGAGEPIVFISGFATDHLAWRTVQNEFTQHYQVILFDNRGAGQSDTPDMSYSMELFAADTVALIDKLNLKQPHIVGHSMGGMVAQTIAHQYPDKIKSVIISGSRCKSNKLTETLFKFIGNLRRDNVPRERLLEAWLPWIFSNEFLAQPEVIPVLTAFYLNNPYPQTQLGYDRQLAAVLNFDSTPWIQHIKTPTLVIAAEKDLVIPPEQSREIADKIPHAQFTLLPHAGHAMMVEQPELFAKIVQEFLQKN
jgi:3-oxoadipate enol-lactonase